MALHDKPSKVTTTYYDKPFYYLNVHSLRKVCGAQMSGIWMNEDPNIQNMLREAIKHGLLRLELRFERRDFADWEYYESQLQEALFRLISSCAMRQRPVNSYWQAICSKI